MQGSTFYNKDLIVEDRKGKNCESTVLYDIYCIDLF